MPTPNHTPVDSLLFIGHLAQQELRRAIEHLAAITPPDEHETIKPVAAILSDLLDRILDTASEHVTDDRYSDGRTPLTTVPIPGADRTLPYLWSPDPDLETERRIELDIDGLGRRIIAIVPPNTITVEDPAITNGAS